MSSEVVRMRGVEKVVFMIQQGLRICRSKLARIFVKCSEVLLPAGYYVQELPYGVRNGLLFKDWNVGASDLNERPDKTPRDAVRWFMLRLLMQEAARMDAGHVAELGTYKGKTAKVLYEALPEGASLYCFWDCPGKDCPRDC